MAEGRVHQAQQRVAIARASHDGGDSVDLQVQAAAQGALDEASRTARHASAMVASPPAPGGTVGTLVNVYA